MELMGNMRRTHYSTRVTEEMVGQEVVVAGYIAKNRDLGAVIFCDVRDTKGIIQLNFNDECPRETFEKAKLLRTEYVVMAKGVVALRESPNNNIPTGKIEILVKEMKLLSKADTKIQIGEKSAAGMGAAVTFVMALSAVVTWLLQTYILVPLGIEYMQTIVFILVIAALVQMVEIVLKKVSPSLYQALGIFLPLITTNCAVLGVAILMIQKEFSLLQGLVYNVSTALGFALALVIFAGLRERIEFEEAPKAFQGVPIALITASILAMAFMGFSGLV